ncbi:MAG: TolC family outer membrane protein [Gammaproteobacteria bacterium]
MKYFKLPLMLLFLLGNMGAQAIDLKQVYGDAVKNDPRYKASLAENNALIENKSIALSLVLPNLNLSGNMSENDNTTTIAGNKSTNKFQGNGYSLSIRQTIYNHDSFTQLSQADETVAIANANFTGAMQELILRVASSYYNVLGAIDNLDFAVAEKKSIQQQLHQTKQRFDVGLTAITDVHEAQARYDQSVASEIEAENLLAINKEKLREITGILYPTFKSLKIDTPLLRPEPANIDDWIKTAIDNNIALFVANKNMNINKQEISRAQSGHYPTLDLVAAANRSTSSTSFGPEFVDIDRDSTSISLQLNMALYEGGRTSSRSQQAQYSYQQSRQLYELQRRSTERETRTSYLTVIANISQVKALKQALASSKIALKATQAGFEVGTRTAVDVLNSQRELYRAERDYARSRYNYILETLRLRLAAGTLNDTDINNVNTWLVN